jgi:hypothetical protein
MKEKMKNVKKCAQKKMEKYIIKQLKDVSKSVKKYKV